jgi:NMD protein affecting ribosome stability and mRNA decay
MAKRSSRPGAPPPRADRLIRERVHDPYRSREKLPEPTVCPECDAVYRKGRWLWVELPSGVPRTLCPACQRIRDGYPAGYVSLGGAFFQKHREEIVELVRHVEAREKAEHALNRIMGLEDEGDTLVVTTTDPHLARAIGDAVHRAYQGELDYRYVEGDTLLRVSWARED